MAEMTKEIAGIARTFVEGMGLSLTVCVGEEEDHYRVDLEGDDAWLLVEKKAAALEALQLLLGKVAERRCSPDKRVVVDAGGFRRAREAELKQIALAAAEKVLRLSAPVELSPMNPYERRLVHLALAEEPGVQTDSVGEGHSRRVRISRAPTG